MTFRTAAKDPSGESKKKTHHMTRGIKGSQNQPSMALSCDEQVRWNHLNWVATPDLLLNLFALLEVLDRADLKNRDRARH